MAKIPGLCPVLRQVTPTNFIAGLLGARQNNLQIEMNNEIL
jgi:hypothetical protein